MKALYVKPIYMFFSLLTANNSEFVGLQRSFNLLVSFNINIFICIFYLFFHLLFIY